VIAAFVQAMAVTTNRGEIEALINARATDDSHQLILAMPRLAIA
jgi:hypothetical protein